MGVWVLTREGSKELWSPRSPAGGCWWPVSEADRGSPLRLSSLGIEPEAPTCIGNIGGEHETRPSAGLLQNSCSKDGSTARKLLLLGSAAEREVKPGTLEPCFWQQLCRVRQHRQT